MKSTPGIWMSGKLVLIRHAVSIIFLFTAWKILHRWYFYQHPSDYFLFAFLAICGFALSSIPFLLKEIRKILFFRILACLPLLLLLLPWGEWLGLGTIFTRESWSEMLFKQAAFVYVCVSVLRIFPSLASWITNGFLNLLEFASTKPFLMWAAPVFLFVLTGWIAIFVYQETPVVQDSASHLFQAHIFSQFKLYAAAPPASAAFTGPFDLLVLRDGKWFGFAFPGFAVLLMPFVWGKLEWLVSPILAGLTCAIWIAYANRWHSGRTAFLLAILFLVCPFVVVMSSTVMVFTPELFFASAIIFLARISVEKRSYLYLVSLAIAIAGAILVRPFSILPFLFPILSYSVWQHLRQRRIVILTAIAAGAILGAGCLLYFQWKTTGDPLLSGYQIEAPEPRFGFGKNLLGTHTPLKGIDNISNNLLGLNQWLGGLYSGSLVFVFAFFLHRKIQNWDNVFLVACSLVVLFYFFFFIQDLFFGPRFYYVFTPILLLFIARSVTEVSIDSKFQPQILIPLLVLAILFSVPNTLPAFIKRYDPSKTQAGKLKEQIRKNVDKPTLVFLDDNTAQNFVNWNDPFLKSNVVIARDLEEHNSEVQRFFPNYKPVWFRMTSSFEKGKITGGFKFASEPDRKPSGTLSLFDLAMALQAARDYPKQDFFDICYIDIFNSGSGRENFEFLNDVKDTNLRGGEYKRVFRSGVIHAGKMLLLPLIAFDERGHDWKLSFNRSEFRKEFNSARSDFVQSGDIGRTILDQMDKVKRRIDQNSDQQLSDSEIDVFLVEKMKLVSMGASL